MHHSITHISTYKQTPIRTITMSVQWMHKTSPLPPLQEAQPQHAVYYSFADIIAMHTKTCPTCPALVGHLCKTLTHYQRRQTSAVLGVGSPRSTAQLSEWHPVQAQQDAHVDLEPVVGSLAG